MRRWLSKASSAIATIEALNRSYAICEFAPDGSILDANPKLLNMYGINLSELRRKTHSFFVSEDMLDSDHYHAFWQNLVHGIPQNGEYRRVGHDGSEIWLRALYSPILDRAGKVIKIIATATDATHEIKKAIDYEGQMNAIHASHSVIELTLAGHIIWANETFLQIFGYKLEEIQGQHHRILVDEQYAASQSYKDFWAGIRSGSFQSGEFERRAKNGEAVYIVASYNLISDFSGRPIKIVKFATDVSPEVRHRRDKVSIARDVRMNLAVVKDESRIVAQEASDAASQAETVRETVSITAAKAKELRESGRRVTNVVEASLAMVERAVDETKTTASKIAGLHECTERISEVSSLIASVANQINLLALNATIEAARAGDAGRGFSIVAQEVKALAKQTGEAAGRIGAEIQAVQQASIDSVHAMQKIEDTMRELAGAAVNSQKTFAEQSESIEGISSGMSNAFVDMSNICTTLNSIATSIDRVDESTRRVSSIAERIVEERPRDAPRPG